MDHRKLTALLSALVVMSLAAVPAAADEPVGDSGSGIVSEQPDETPDEDKDQEQDAPLSLGAVAESDKFTCTADAVRINWTAVEGAEGYEVYRFDESAEDWALIGTIEDGSAVTYRDGGLAAGSTYRYKVRAYLSDGGEKIFGEFSGEIETQTRYKLSAPKVTLSNSANKITVKFTECENADGYFIYMSTKPDSGFTRIKATPNLSYTKSKLADSTKYYFKVRAYKTLAGKKYYGEYSDVKSAMSYEFINAKKAADLYSGTSFSSGKLGSVKAGKAVILIDKEGCWYKVRVGGKTGYIYNMAFGAGRNTSGLITAETLPAAADDILFTCGATPAGIQAYVTYNVGYMSRGQLGSRDAMVLYAMNYRAGSCYYYAAFCDYLLERLGYEHRIVYGSNRNSGNPHSWNLYKSESGWRHLDACYSNWGVGAFTGWTDYTVRSRTPFYWNSNNYPAAN